MHVLAIDAGTTGVTAVLVDERGRVVARRTSEITQHYPRPGWVEHDPEEIWRVTRRLVGSMQTSRVAAVGITNQRETTVIWDRRTGRPIHPAIVWQCRRTAEMCRRLREHEPAVRRRTGLVLDAYFSASKIRWLLEQVSGAARGARAGRLAFGTIDAWLIWKLTGGRAHMTDVTNASRTMIFDIHRRRWDPELLRLFRVQASLLPRVLESTGRFGEVRLGGRAVPIHGVAGDQQAALYGQGCFAPGMMKNTYGTGCFLVMNAGSKPPPTRRGLITTLACDGAGRPVYAQEGSVFIAGAVIQWLRDAAGMIRTAGESERVAAGGADGVYFVPAFVGLGAPYWDMEARGAILGLTRGTGRAQIVRAALESMAYQTRDVVEAMGARPRELRVDGGAVANDLLMQFQADLLGARVVRPKNIGSTSLGAAFLAGVGAGIWSGGRSLSRLLKVDRVFRPSMTRARRERLYAGWKAAVARVRS
jgi:glycerol kinase